MADGVTETEPEPEPLTVPEPVEAPAELPAPTLPEPEPESLALALLDSESLAAPELAAFTVTVMLAGTLVNSRSDGYTVTVAVPGRYPDIYSVELDHDAVATEGSDDPTVQDV